MSTNCANCATTFLKKCTNCTDGKVKYFEGGLYRIIDCSICNGSGYVQLNNTGI
jgi:hypothetical protein